MELPQVLASGQAVTNGDRVSCCNCHKLLCKRLPDGRLDVVWRDIKVVVKGTATVHCPRCHVANEVSQ